MRLIPVWLVLLSAAACAPPHHALSAPSATAGEAERLAAYERLASQATAGTMMVDASGAVASSSTDYLILGDGTRIAHVDDLAPAVDAASPTGRAIARHRRGVSRGAPWRYAGASALVIGIVAGAVLPFTLDDHELAAGVGAFSGGLVLGLGLVSVGALVEGDPAGERLSAFTTYNADLRKHLGLCVDGMKVVPCERVAPVGATSTEPAARAEAAR